SAVGTKVDKDLVIERHIVRSKSGGISRQWHVGCEAIAESLRVIPRIAMVTLILPSLEALLYAQPVGEVRRSTPSPSRGYPHCMSPEILCSGSALEASVMAGYFTK